MGAAASEHQTTERPGCGAKTRAGTPCRKDRGWGTDHLGFGNCKLHGGASPAGQVHAARLHAEALALEYQVEPHDALLRAVGQAAHWELVCRLKVSQLEDHQVVITHEKRVVEHTPVLERDGEEYVRATGVEIREEKVETSTSADLNIWVKSHLQAVRDLASIAKTAIDAGVDERRVRIAEALGGQLADVLGAIFSELELTAEQRAAAQPVVRRHLVALEGGVAA